MSYDTKIRRNGARPSSRAHGGQRLPKEVFTRGRKFSSEDLQAMLLMLLSEQPRHGYELIKAIEMRSNGYYHPSPGVIYPALNQLVEKGYASVMPQGARKQYLLSENGQEALVQVRDKAELLCARLGHAARKMAWFNEAMNDQQAAVNATGWSPEFVEARRRLREALLMKSDASLAVQAVLIPIILEAAQAIAAIANTPSTSSPTFGAHHD